MIGYTYDDGGRAAAGRGAWDWSFERLPHAIRLDGPPARAFLAQALDAPGLFRVLLAPAAGADHRLEGTAAFALGDPASRNALSEIERLCRRG